MTPTELLKRLRTRPTPEKLETVEQYRKHVISEHAGKAGSAKSAAKAEAAKRNGAKGGRPRKAETKPETNTP